MEDMKLILSQRLRKLRDEKEISQEYLSKQVGVTQSSIGNYERGEKLPNADTIRKICEVYNVSADYLLGLSGEANYQSPRLKAVPEGAMESYNKVISSLEEMVSYSCASEYKFSAMKHYASMFSMFLEIDEVVAEEVARMRSLYPDFISFGKLDAVEIDGSTFLAALIKESPEAKKYVKAFNESLEKIGVRVQEVRNRIGIILTADVFNAVTCRTDVSREKDEGSNDPEKVTREEGK